MDTTGLSAVQARLAAYQRQFHAAVGAGAATTAAQVTAWEQANHRWQNQTGAAAAGLHCTVVPTPSGVRLLNAHGVPYGRWLELRWQGRYAILLEALRRQMPGWLAAIAQRAPGSRGA